MVIYIYDNHLHTIVSIFQLYFMNSLAFRWSLQPTVLIGSLDSGDQPALIPLCFFALLNTYTADFSGLVFQQKLSYNNWVWVNTYRYIFSGMNIHKSQLFWGSLGIRVLTHPQLSKTDVLPAKTEGPPCFFHVFST